MMKFLRNKKGQGMSEYLIILALVAIATIGAVIFFADNVRMQIQNLATEIAGDEGDTVLDATHQAGADLSGDMDTYVTADD
jgi:Flp pilus assembly pilin Flp